MDISLHIFAVDVLGIGGHLALAATSPMWEHPQYMHWGGLLPDASAESGLGWSTTPLGLPLDARDILGPWKAGDGSYLALSNEYIGTLRTITITSQQWQTLDHWSMELMAARVDYDPFGWRGVNSNSAVVAALYENLDVTLEPEHFDRLEKPKIFGFTLPGRLFPGKSTRTIEFDPECRI